MKDQTDNLPITRKSAEPGVINEEMLLALVISQGPKNEAGRLYLKDGIKLEEITEIRIEFLNILNIDHLWVMRNLVQLKLSNNWISKIVNLDALVHLKELDLSFNHIEVMENLNHLNHLEILLLHENQISRVEGIDNLTELTILNIGHNVVTDWDHVIYLRKMEHLRSLNMEGNPCSGKEGYADYIYAIIPQLVYYQYKIISEEKRESATEKHYQDIRKLLEDEAKDCENSSEQRILRKDIGLLSLSYIDHFDGDYLFEQMFKRDKAGSSLLMLSDDVQTACQEFRASFTIICKELYELGLAEQLRMLKEIEAFEDVVNEGQNDTQQDTQLMMDEIMEKKALIFTDVKKLMQSITEDLGTERLDEKMERAHQLSDEFSELVTKSWNKLMHKEVILHEQMEDIIEFFKLNITEIVDSFRQGVQGLVTQMRNCENTYNSNINSIADAVMNEYLLRKDDRVPLDLVDVFTNKDILTNNLAASHDIHLQIIDECEDCLTSELKTWLQDKIANLSQDETNRNRQKILEISHFLEYQFEEFNTMQLQHSSTIDTRDSNGVTVLEQ